MEACIKFITPTMKICFDSGSDVHIALLQKRTTPLGQGLPSPATLLFNCPVRGIMPVMDRPPININKDYEHHKALVNRQYRNEQGKDTSKKFVSLPIESTVTVQQADRGHGPIDDKGDHNHHDRSYKIHITKTEKIITHNRQHITPTPISVEQYLHNQLAQHTKTDSLNTILDHLEKHPPPPIITDTTNKRPQSSNTTHKHTIANNVQNNSNKQPEETNVKVQNGLSYANSFDNSDSASIVE